MRESERERERDKRKETEYIFASVSHGPLYVDKDRSYDLTKRGREQKDRDGRTCGVTGKESTTFPDVHSIVGSMRDRARDQERQ